MCCSLLLLSSHPQSSPPHLPSSLCSHPLQPRKMPATARGWEWGSLHQETHSPTPGARTLQRWSSWWTPPGRPASPTPCQTYLPTSAAARSSGSAPTSPPHSPPTALRSAAGLTTRSLLTLRRLLRSPSLTCHTLHIADWVHGSPNIRPAGSTEDWLQQAPPPSAGPPPCLSTIQLTQSEASAASSSANKVGAAGPAL